MSVSRHMSKLVVSRLAGHVAATLPGISLPPQAFFAELFATLESIRLLYLYHRFGLVDSQLQELEQRLELAVASQTDSESANRFSLVRASLLVFKGRVRARRKSHHGTELFREAADIFGALPVQDEVQPAASRFRTDHAIALYRLNRCDEAVALLEIVCNGSHSNADAFAYLGYARRYTRDWAGASEYLHKSLEICGAQPTVLYWLGRSLLAQGPENNAQAEEVFCRGAEHALSAEDYRTAAKCGERALKVNPACVSGLHLAVEGHRGQHRIRRAFQLVDKFLETQPGSKQALVLRGVLLRDSHFLEQSVEVLRSIPADGPEHDWVAQELLNSLYQWTEAPEEDLLQAAEEVLARNPQHLTAMCAKGSVRLTRGNIDEAVHLFETAVKIAPKSGTALLGLGKCYERLNKQEQAFASYRKAARASGADPQLFVMALAGLRGTGEQQDVLDELASLSSGPLGHYALWLLSDIHIEQGDRSSALAILQEAVRIASSQDEERQCPGLLIDYGHALRHARRYGEAEDVFRHVLKVKTDAEALAAFARLKADVGEYQLALEYVQDALKQAPEDARLLDQAGWCMQHLIDLDGARDAYQRAYELEKNPWYRKGLANVLMNYPHQREAARAHFQGVLEELKHTSENETKQERPAGNWSNLGLLGWCNYRLGQHSEAIRLLQFALEVSPEIEPLWYDLVLAFLASGRGALAEEVYRKGCARTEKAEVPRQRGVYYVAAFDMAELVRESGDQLPAEAAAIFADLRRRLEHSGQDVSKLAWLPEAADLYQPREREAAIERIGEVARSAEDEHRRLLLRELLRAAGVRFGDENWHKDLLLRAHAEDWPAWAVQCLSFPEKIDFSFPGGPEATYTVLWRVAGDILAHGGIQPWKAICADEVYLFEKLPEQVEEPMRTLRAHLEEARTAFPYRGERACRVAALEAISDVGTAVFAAITEEPERALIEFRKAQLAMHGLASSVS